MKIIPRENAENYSLPLPIFKSLHIANAISKEGKEFDVLVGLDKKYVDQMRELSASEGDTDLQNFTGDRKRFVEGTYEYWYKKNRSIFALIHKQNDDLAAIIWFGPKPLGKKSPKFGINETEISEGERDMKSEWHTISFRSYPKYRGKGLMKSFSQFAIGLYKSHLPNAKLWTGTDDRNAAFIRLITDLGFSVDEESSDLGAHWLILKKI
ncbi:MAG: hypothetical protein WCT29_00415 [Candidatus Paceibacterota bacterium]|jgi:GNAT superfamily N-acetyltransferase